MEADRAQADLGKAVESELIADDKQQQKQPKKRFIGRKEAAERAEKSGDINGTIEDSGAIQGEQETNTLCEWNTDILQLHEPGGQLERSIKSPPKFSMIQKSTTQYLFYLRTIHSKYQRQYTEYVHLAPKRWPCNFQRVCCFLLPPSQTSSLGSAQGLRL